MINKLNLVIEKSTLQENINISEAQYENSKNIRHEISSMVENRDNYIKNKNYDPLFCLPTANWSFDETITNNDIRKAYKHVLTGDYNVINRLRLYTQVFTGYQLFSMRRNILPGELNPLSSIPFQDEPDWEKHFNTVMPNTDHWVEMWIQMALNFKIPYLINPPNMLGEIGWKVNGIIVNHDTVGYQDRVHTLYDSRLINWLEKLQSKKTVRILEIGGGYGALSHALHKFINNAEITICDIPESLLFSNLYLKLVNPRANTLACTNEYSNTKYDFRFMANYMFQDIVDSNEKYDLVINTLSLSEMSELQVHTYGAGISALIGSKGIFFEQNHDNKRYNCSNAKEILPAYFKNRKTLNSKISYNIEGQIDLWSNLDADSIIN